MNVLEVLKAARAKITKPEAWTQRQLARAWDEQPVDVRSDAATCWCSIGAIFFVTDYPLATAGDEQYKAINALSFEMGTDVAHYNDNMEHADVLAKFDAAIATLEKRIAA